jgi:hypothetical protein
MRFLSTLGEKQITIFSNEVVPTESPLNQVRIGMGWETEL